MNISCPVCNMYTFEGSYDICEVCGWENDPVQLRYPDEDGGANTESLNQAIENWKNRAA